MTDEEKTLQPVLEEETPVVEVVEEPSQNREEQPKAKEASALQQMKDRASEDDDAPIGSLTLRQIVGGDYLFTLVRHHVPLILLVVLITTVYIAFRYQCQQDVIEINRLEGELVKAKYKSMSSSSNLTEMCRQGNVLRLNQDTLLMVSDQPPFIVEIPEE
jgi:hypothetical protein